MFRRAVLPLMILILALFSLMTLKSIAPALLNRQAMYFCIGGVLFFVTARTSFERWLQLSPYLYGFLIFLLVLTHSIGQMTRGTTSWIPIGSFHIQPSQLAIVCSGLFLCRFLYKKGIPNFSRLVIFLGILLTPAILIFLEPELGTTIVYMFSLGSLFFLSETRPTFMISAIVAAFLCLFIGWNFLLHPYQKERITSFLDTQRNTSDAGYNAHQALIAVGSGQLYGRGIGQGVQSQLRFLPERQTDFVFASFAEEMGTVGAVPVILLYATLCFFILFVGMHAETRAQQFFCSSTAIMIAVQAGINIGMNMGLLPITGITLPFFSYGGSSILALCFQFGCVQSIILRYHKKVVLEIK